MGANFVLGGLAKNSLSPWALTFFRFLIAIIVLSPFYLSRLIHYRKTIKRYLPTLFLFSIIGATIPAGFTYLAFQNTNNFVSTSLIYTITPILTLVFSMAILKDKLLLYQLFGAILSIIGAILLVIQGDITSLENIQFNIGSIYMIIVTISWAFYTTMLKHIRIDLPKGLDLYILLILSMITVIPCYAYDLLVGKPTIFTIDSIIIMLFAGIGIASIGWWLYIQGVRIVGPSKSGFYLYLMPVFGTLISLLFFKSHIDIKSYVAIGLIVIGVIIVNIKKIKKSSNRN